MDITIQYKQPTVQFGLLAYSICVDFACFYVEFAFQHYAKKSWKSKLKKNLTSCKYFFALILILRKNLVQAKLNFLKIAAGNRDLELKLKLKLGFTAHSSQLTVTVRSRSRPCSRAHTHTHTSTAPQPCTRAQLDQQQ